MPNDNKILQKLSDKAAKPNPEFIKDLRSRTLSKSVHTPPYRQKQKLILAASIACLAMLFGVVVNNRNSDNSSRASEQNHQQGNQQAPDTGAASEINQQLNAASSQTSSMGTSPDNQNSNTAPTQNQEQGDQQSRLPAVVPSPPQNQPASPAPPAPPPNLSTDFTARYWELGHFTTPPVIPYQSAPGFTENTQGITKDWGGQSPGGSINPNFFVMSATAQKQLNNGTHTFLLTHDDGARLYVNGQLVVNDWQSGPVRTQSHSIYLANQELVNIVVEYYDKTGQASVTLLIN